MCVCVQQRTYTGGGMNYYSYEFILRKSMTKINLNFDFSKKNNNRGVGIRVGVGFPFRKLIIGRDDYSLLKSKYIYNILNVSCGSAVSTRYEGLPYRCATMSLITW